MNENIKTWTAALRDPSLRQTTAKLCRLDDDDNESFCCLGVAASLTPNMEIVPPHRCDCGPSCENDRCPYHGEPVVYFDNEEDLLPPRAVAWLGLSDTVDSAVDLEPDWPQEIGELCQQGHRLESGDEPVHYSSPEPLRGLTLASLNDSGFTFSQIADIIDYFHVRLP